MGGVGVALGAERLPRGRRGVCAAEAGADRAGEGDVPGSTTCRGRVAEANWKRWNQVWRRVISSCSSEWPGVHARAWHAVAGVLVGRCAAAMGELGGDDTGLDTAASTSLAARRGEVSGDAGAAWRSGVGGSLWCGEVSGDAFASALADTAASPEASELGEVHGESACASVVSKRESAVLHDESARASSDGGDGAGAGRKKARSVG